MLVILQDIELINGNTIQKYGSSCNLICKYIFDIVGLGFNGKNFKYNLSNETQRGYT